MAPVTRCHILRTCPAAAAATTSCSGHCSLGNTCSQIPVCWVFSEEGKTWYGWVLLGFWVLHVDHAPSCCSESGSKLQPGLHLVARLQLSHGRPLHSSCCHWSCLSWRDTCADPCVCQTPRSPPRRGLAPLRRLTAEKNLYCCLEMLVLESGAESEGTHGRASEGAACIDFRNHQGL